MSVIIENHSNILLSHSCLEFRITKFVAVVLMYTIPAKMKQKFESLSTLNIDFVNYNSKKVEIFTAVL